MIAFLPGEQVRLTSRFAAVLNKSTKRRVDWLGRKGVVRRCNSRSAYIVWEGCKSIDPVPVKGVERVGK